MALLNHVETLYPVFLTIMLFFSGIAMAAAQENQAVLPEGEAGIAMNYPGDQGIEEDENVIFAEDFEETSIAVMTKNWESIQRQDIMSFSQDTPAESSGNQSLLITHTGGDGTGGHLYRRLQPGYDQVFARFYVKFDQDCAPIHHFGTHLGGFNPSTPWPQGGAGEKPEGDKRFTTGVEPFGTDWGWDFYTYWQGMRIHGDGNYWGTPFLSGVEKPRVEKDRWICIEMMVKLNNPVTASNGEQAFWVDGKLWRVHGQVVSHIGQGFPKGSWSGGWWQPNHTNQTTFDGFQWRTVEELAINYIWTYVYITRAPEDHISRIWFDDIVVAKKYIGPLTPVQTSVEHRDIHE
jgi:hypothetical protein